VTFSPRRRTATGVALAALLLLTGCSGSSEKDAEKIREAILDNAPGVEDAIVRYNTDIFTNNLSIQLSMPTTSSTDDEALTTAIVETLEQAWNTSPSEPSNIRIRVSVVPFAEGDRIGDPSAVTLNGRGVDEALGLYSDVSWDVLTVSTEELTERFGPRDGS